MSNYIGFYADGKEFQGGFGYMRSESDGSVTPLEQTVEATSSGCSVLNAVSEVFYTVFYKPKGGLYEITRVVYDIII